MKLTPLNIVLACFLTWVISEWGNEQLRLPWWGIGLFLMTLLFGDVVFRLFVKDIKKLWLAQIGFILMTGILLVLIKALAG
ncbi:hypothetical protein BC792_101290 [Sphingobacterium allocomposti]|jgi:hypothetical protein|uniref:Uncharacterized protein n=1 Tax=Sphingobacterium allocomposti TaxID=415956 RepID=A0A5S5DV34_9SPHI|nr:hypothetical protein [Sphingobacterium composti Yoo et al. 2007 non Ten et al. 2007]TYP98632.1 hypothetical protein BC792_101290 [Sphingobacterium composti Yoo et al. 2007 non Ten et al. 2007]HLS95374.1 hypothetical protein [Sphingobacterium sp.]